MATTLANTLSPHERLNGDYLIVEIATEQVVV